MSKNIQRWESESTHSNQKTILVYSSREWDEIDRTIWVQQCAIGALLGLRFGTLNPSMN